MTTNLKKKLALYVSHRGELKEAKTIHITAAKSIHIDHR
jgi:hypothetical protein